MRNIDAALDARLEPTASWKSRAVTSGWGKALDYSTPYSKEGRDYYIVHYISQKNIEKNEYHYENNQ
jgi:hypothetical protein